MNKQEFADFIKEINENYETYETISFLTMARLNINNIVPFFNSANIIYKIIPSDNIRLLYQKDVNFILLDKHHEQLFMKKCNINVDEYNEMICGYKKHIKALKYLELHYELKYVETYKIVLNDHTHVTSKCGLYFIDAPAPYGKHECKSLEEVNIWLHTNWVGFTHPI